MTTFKFVCFHYRLINNINSVFTILKLSNIYHFTFFLPIYIVVVFISTRKYKQTPSLFSNLRILYFFNSKIFSCPMSLQKISYCLTKKIIFYHSLNWSYYTMQCIAVCNVSMRFHDWLFYLENGEREGGSTIMSLLCSLAAFSADTKRQKCGGALARATASLAQ